MVEFVKKKILKKIKTHPLSRTMSIAKLSISTGVRLTGHLATHLFSSTQKKSDHLKALWLKQFQSVSEELGRLKGSMMKVGQMLSVVGEYFFSPEANEFLKKLHYQSPPLEWEAIEEILKKELGQKKYAELAFDTAAYAAASLGQVHLAKVKNGLKNADGQDRMFAIKIQYAGVDRAIDSDVKLLRSFLGAAKLIPKLESFDLLFQEIKDMLHREIDYGLEAESMQRFRELLLGDDRYVIPTFYPEYSTGKILALSFEDGLPIDSAEVRSLSVERRSALGVTVLELYFKELIQHGIMQTDPHFGNYRIRLGPPDQIVLYDFGAVKVFSKEFLGTYLEMLEGTFNKEEKKMICAARKLGFLTLGDSSSETAFVELCTLFLEPFQGGIYDWGKSDLPKLVSIKISQFARANKLRPPPHEIVFLDRKMAGVFIMLAKLEARINGREILSRFLKLREDSKFLLTIAMLILTSCASPSSKTVSLVSKSRRLSHYSYASGCYHAYQRICKEFVTEPESKQSRCFDDALEFCEKNAKVFSEWLQTGTPSLDSIQSEVK